MDYEGSDAYEPAPSLPASKKAKTSKRTSMTPIKQDTELSDLTESDGGDGGTDDEYIDVQSNAKVKGKVRIPFRFVSMSEAYS